MKSFWPAFNRYRIIYIKRVPNLTFEKCFKFRCDMTICYYYSIKWTKRKFSNWKLSQPLLMNTLEKPSEKWLLIRHTRHVNSELLHSTDIWPSYNPRHNNKLKLFSQRMWETSMGKLILFLFLCLTISDWLRALSAYIKNALIKCRQWRQLVTQCRKSLRVFWFKYLN